MVYAQLGQNFGSENLFGTLAGTYYSFEDNTALGSFLTDGSNSDYHFGGIYALSGEVGLKNLFGNGTKASIYTDWVTNGDTSTDADNGYLVGVKASNGAWSLNYSYADLEQNAWPDIFADSDRFDGLTGIRGHEIVLSYNIMKNVVLAVDYYIMESKVLNEDQRLLQLDLNVKF
ncbi:MAG: putative porin [Gammaproteobacteria bacterium]